MLQLEKMQLNELQEFLEHVNKKVGFLGTFICSDEGLIVLATKNNNINFRGAIDIESIVAVLASFLFKNEIMDISFINDLAITIDRILIHVHLLNDVKTRQNRLFLINLIPIEIRYYKRIIKKLDTKLQEFLI
ncbi:MAG: hypothetical protein ACTSRB_11015 [Candidatus Helarchaeota archaeon]